MSNPRPLLNTTANNVAEWLFMAGVLYEVQDTPHSWVAPAALPASIPANLPIHPSSIPAVQSLSQFADLAAFHTYLQGWRGIGLCSTATHTVLGQGTMTPAIMVIAEAPDDHEDRTGLGFSGVAQRLVLQALAHAGFTAAHIYTTYVSKWRPPGQRSLAKHELNHLLPQVQEEIRLVRPKAILVLGESLAQTLIAAFDPAASRPDPTQKLFYHVKNQSLDYTLPFQGLQKSEILVNTMVMKKTFWLSLLSFTAALRADEFPVSGDSASHNMEYISDVH